MNKLVFFTFFTLLSFNSQSQDNSINLKKGLVAHFPLNGTVIDESGNNIDAIAKGVKPTSDRKNNSDFAYHFDGKSYIKISKNFYGFNELTISLWFKTGDCNGDFQALISSTESGEFEHLQIHNNPTNSTNSGAFTNGGITTLACPSCYPIDKWRHLVLVCQSNNSKLYENGKIISSEKTTFSRINSTNTLLIGAGFKFQRFFNGEMEDVRIYNRALSGAEIEALYDGNQQSNEISYASTPQKKTATNISTEQQHEKNTKTKEEQETIAWQVKAYKKFQEEEAEREKKRNYKLENEKYLVQNKVKQGIVTTSTGLQYQILKKGTGGKPNMNNRVLVHYICKLIDGTIWDNSYQRNEELNISLKQVTKGWQEGILMMNEGAKYRFFIPYYLAYGEKGNGQTVPPYSTLICDVELIRSVVVDISDETASELDKILNSMAEDSKGLEDLLSDSQQKKTGTTNSSSRTTSSSSSSSKSTIKDCKIYCWFHKVDEDSREVEYKAEFYSENSIQPNYKIAGGNLIVKYRKDDGRWEVSNFSDLESSYSNAYDLLNDAFQKKYKKLSGCSHWQYYEK